MVYGSLWKGSPGMCQKLKTIQRSLHLFVPTYPMLMRGLYGVILGLLGIMENTMVFLFSAKKDHFPLLGKQVLSCTLNILQALYDPEHKARPGIEGVVSFCHPPEPVF